MSELAYSRMFLIAALWNLVGGVFILAAAPWVFASSGLSVPDPAVYFHAWIALFMTFGIGYYLVSRDLYAGRDIVLLGIIGKLAFSAIFLFHMVDRPGTIPTFFLIPVAGDLAFVALFAHFLRHARLARLRGAFPPAQGEP